jgi:DNA processing protein
VVEDEEVRERLRIEIERIHPAVGNDETRPGNALEHAWDALRRSGGRLVTPEDAEYPGGLRDLGRAPTVFLKGSWESGHRPVAIVGTREASREGCRVAFQIAEDLASYRIPVVSGMALGIDAAAHRGALAGGGTSGAVLGTALDGCYPPEHETLQAEVAGSLGLLTEVLPGFRPTKGTFAARNRLLAALSAAVIVVEAKGKSGALLTSGAANHLKRPVGAIPWPIWSERGEGPHQLIRSGRAELIRSTDDVLTLIGFRGSSVRAGGVSRGARPALEASPETDLPLSPRERLLLDALEERPQRIDEIASGAGLSIAELGAALVSLELLGLVQRDPGGAIRKLRFR